MKKLLPILLVMILIISGCQGRDDKESISPDEVTTFDEVIEDDKVEIDGISYDIESVSKSTYKYDDSGNIIERIDENNDRKVRTEFTYNENDEVLEEKYYYDSNLTGTRTYSYEEDLLVKIKNIFEGELERYTEYSYEEDKEIATTYNSDDTKLLMYTVYKDENGNNSKAVFDSPEGQRTTVEYEYEDNLLMKSTSEGKDTKVITHYEYNNLGDKIMEYTLTRIDGLNNLTVYFFEYEYNEDLQIITSTLYRVSTLIEEENIRDFK